MPRLFSRYTKTFTASSMALLSLMPTTLSLASTPESVARPPQFVVMAFDGSKSLSMWKETRDFAKRMTAAGKPLKFTYFINAAYYLAYQDRMSYIAPRLGAGKSAIGFGDKVPDVVARVDQTNLAYAEGNEIANHAAGHFDGSNWSEAEWKSEFTQFYDLIENFLSYNKTQPSSEFPQGWNFNFKKEMIGFRAPQLGANSAMFATLPQFGIAYDTSLTASTNYWPHRNAQGIWNFPLSSIAVAGMGRKTLSMDYNFYYVQSGAKENPTQADKYEEQMYQSYLNYFQQNYNGNRAPLNIGHHFALWNNGAYWKAEQRFASAVCGLPEVKCVTYRELMAFMNSQTPEALAAYQAGAFPKLQPISLASREQFLDLDIHMAVNKTGGFEARLSGKHADIVRDQGGVSIAYFINGQPIQASLMSLDTIRKLTATGGTATMEAHVYQNDQEIQYVGYRVLDVGSGHERYETLADGALIADPAAAHNEEGAENAAQYRKPVFSPTRSTKSKTLEI